jgi:hypothetical protein
MTSTLKIIIAVVVIALVGFAVYRMSDKPQTSSDSMMEDDAPPAATGDLDGILSALDADAAAEAGVAVNEDDADLIAADSQAVTDLNESYAENSF